MSTHPASQPDAEPTLAGTDFSVDTGSLTGADVVRTISNGSVEVATSACSRHCSP